MVFHFREIKKLDKDLKICFLTAGEMYYGVYSYILSRLPANYFIRKPIGNEEMVNHINKLSTIILRLLEIISNLEY